MTFSQSALAKFVDRASLDWQNILFSKVGGFRLSMLSGWESKKKFSNSSKFFSHPYCLTSVRMQMFEKKKDQKAQRTKL